MTASAEVRALRRAAAWDPSFHERSPWFWPIAPAASVFARHAGWPDPALYGRAREQLPVRFVEAPPPTRRVRAEPREPYDARIVLAGEVPTRRGDWHDFLNALVWATFPRAKLALHGAQHAAIRAAQTDPAHVPGTRTREHDALALLDEGGVIALEPQQHTGGRPPLLVIFGHALYEGLVLGRAVMIARVLPVSVPSLPASDAERLAIVEDALVSLIARGPRPEQLARFGLTVRVD